MRQGGGTALWTWMMGVPEERLGGASAGPHRVGGDVIMASSSSSKQHHNQCSLSDCSSLS